MATTKLRTELAKYIDDDYRNFVKRELSPIVPFSESAFLQSAKLPPPFQLRTSYPPSPSLTPPLHSKSCYFAAS